MKRLLGLVLCTACSHGTPFGALGRLLAPTSEGWQIVPKKPGGQAEPVYLGTVYATDLGAGQAAEGVTCLDDDDPTDGTYGCNAGFGIGGAGGHGLGYGGGGTGIGAGRRQAGETAKTAEVERCEADQEVRYHPLAWAELQLPHRQGPAGKFRDRQDATISESTVTWKDELSTFAADVDTAAYSLARHALLQQQRPNPTLVRPEEMLNYFQYRYQPPRAPGALFALEADGAESPTESGTYLLRVGLQARAEEATVRVPANLVFLVDTSCSMTGPNRLDLAKEALAIAVDHLSSNDTVAITTYAGSVRLVLPPTPGDQKEAIKAALAELTSGGGTAMSDGLTLAYQQAAQMLRPGSLSRIIVCSDGDANIGATEPEALLKRIAAYKEAGVTLSTVGFGDGNYRDAMMERLANQGNGNYFYVDSRRQAERVFGRDLTKMVQEIARDVKLQLDLDTRAVANWRLVGYENRSIRDQDFRDDAVDAGEIGVGHQMTALYELTLHPQAHGRLGTLRVRAKLPDGKDAKETALPLEVSLVRRPFHRAPDDLRFAAAVMGAAELWRNSPHAAQWSWNLVLSAAQGANRHQDPDRSEFIELARRSSETYAMVAPRRLHYP